MDRSEWRQPPPEVGIFTVEFDRAIEAADALERRAPDREVAAVEHRASADPQWTRRCVGGATTRS
jgi:hypothetical protein